MTSEQKAAYINAKTASMLCEMYGMIALNTHRSALGYSIAYDDEAFFALPGKYGLEENSLVDYCFKGDE